MPNERACSNSNFVYVDGASNVSLSVTIYEIIVNQIKTA